MTDILHGLGAWYNGDGSLDTDVAAEVARAQAARLNYLVIKYGNPLVEQAFSAGGIMWGTERFVYANDPAGEATMLANAVDAGARFAVINAESGGGFGPDQASGDAMTALIDAFRARHADTPLYACIDTRGPRTSDPYEQVMRARCDGWMPMCYSLQFYPTRPAGYVHSGIGDALAPTTPGLGIAIHPVLQAYGGIGANDLLQEVREAAPYGLGSISFYTIGHATDDEWQQVVNLRHIIDMGASASNTLANVSAAFYRVGESIARGLPASSIHPQDRNIVKYIAALLPPGA